MRLRGLARSLHAVSPLATVARGYAILQHDDGRIVRSVGDAAAGDALDARLVDGRLRVRVESSASDAAGAAQRTTTRALTPQLHEILACDWRTRCSGKPTPTTSPTSRSQANTDLEVIDKYTGKPRHARGAGRRRQRAQAIAAAYKAREAMAAFPPDARRDVLEHCVRRFQERLEELALALCIEAGKPIKDARGEVTRLIDTFRIAAEEAMRIGGEVLELQISPRTRGYRGMLKRVPIGAVQLHHAVQLPAQPGRAQGRAGDRGGLPVRAQAGGEDAGRRADHRRGAGRDRPAEGRVLDPALPNDDAGAAGRGRAPQAAELHRRPASAGT